MKSITQALSDHFQGALTSLATCWKITRRDGVVLGFTDHDVSINIEGLTYIASSGYFRSAIANSATVAVDNLEVRGFLDNVLISEVDLRNGAYDFAEVEIFAVNWQDLSHGICRLRYGYFGETNLRPSGLFVVELRGLMQLFSQTVGETISPDCRADLGDRRCKINLVPDIRNSARFYEEGQRVIVPDDEINTAIGLSIQNSIFSWYENDDYFGIWQGDGGVITNFPGKPRSGTYYVRPTAETGRVTREILMDPGTGLTEFEFLWWGYSEEYGWEVGATIELLHIHGVRGTITDVVDTVVIPYAMLDIYGTITGWDPMGGIVEHTIPEEVNALRISVRWRPGPAGPTDYSQLRIDDIYFRFGSNVVEDVYQSMSLPNPSTVNGAIGWDGGFLRTHPGNVNILPASGTSFLTCSFWGFNSASQEFDLGANGANVNEVDAGNYVIRSVVTAAGMEWGSTSRVNLEFYNGGGSLISTLSTGYQELTPAREWLERVLEGPVPPLTRSVLVRLNSGLGPLRSSGNPSGAFDSVSVSMYTIDSDTSNILQYRGVEYECINEGITALEQPAGFTHTLGETVTDGDVTWQCVNPAYTFIGEVDEVFSHTEFTVPAINASDNYFKWGVLTFLDGANRTRGVEVLSWNNSTKRMTIMLPALSPIEPGTNIRVHAGCDKTRGFGGCGKFNNILNYRGEPEVPGTDQYFKVGGTGR